MYFINIENTIRIEHFKIYDNCLTIIDFLRKVFSQYKTLYKVSHRECSLLKCKLPGHYFLIK